MQIGEKGMGMGIGTCMCKSQIGHQKQRNIDKQCLCVMGNYYPTVHISVNLKTKMHTSVLCQTSFFCTSCS